jgi:hypothetical protein
MAPQDKDEDEDEDDPLTDELPLSDEVAREARPGLVPEFVRKLAVAGLGALFMTEEGLRSLAGQLKLPKEALAFVLTQAEKTKDDLGRVLSEELRRFLDSEKLRDELLKMIPGMTIEIKAEVRLKPTAKRGEREGSQVEVTEIRTRRAPKKKAE